MVAIVLLPWVLLSDMVATGVAGEKCTVRKVRMNSHKTALW